MTIFEVIYWGEIFIGAVAFAKGLWFLAGTNMLISFCILILEDKA